MRLFFFVSFAFVILSSWSLDAVVLKSIYCNTYSECNILLCIANNCKGDFYLWFFASFAWHITLKKIHFIVDINQKLSSFIINVQRIKCSIWTTYIVVVRHYKHIVDKKKIWKNKHWKPTDNMYNTIYTKAFFSPFHSTTKTEDKTNRDIRFIKSSMLQ